MQYFRVRIIFTNGDIAVLDKAFSQTVEMLKGVSSADKEIFWAGRQSIILPTGENVKFVREV